MGVYDDRPWLARYRAQTPADIEPEFPTALAMFDAAVEHSAERTAVQYFDAAMTFDDVDRLTDELACGLVALGVQRGDRVAAYLQNVPQFVLTMIASWKAGAVMVSVNPMLKGKELKLLLDDSGAEVLVCLESLHRSVAAGVLAETDVREVITTSELDFLEGDRPGPLADSERDRPDETHDLLELARAHEGEEPDRSRTSPTTSPS